ncbi:Flagellar protein FlbB [Chitinispirillum alkaliphilum]|nr:Flagellar protein FlbB [Chitinispirillum alkaliphilum]
MNLRLKDIIAIAVVMCVSFPIIYLLILFLTGTARIEFGPSGDVESRLKQIETVRQSSRRDSLAAVNTKTFLAIQQQRAQLEEERARNQAQKERLDILQREIVRERERLAEKRSSLETLVDKGAGLDEDRVRELARLYGAMRPAEAAAIIETLDDELALRIVTSINDDRQKGRILAALSRAKASRLSRMLGEPVIN